MLAGKVLCVARLYGGPRLMPAGKVLCVSGYMVARDCILAGEVLCVARLYGGPRLYAGWEGSLCSQAIWWSETYAGWEGSLRNLIIWSSETVFWLGRYFV